MQGREDSSGLTIKTPQTGNVTMSYFPTKTRCVGVLILSWKRVFRIVLSVRLPQGIRYVCKSSVWRWENNIIRGAIFGLLGFSLRCCTKPFLSHLVYVSHEMCGPLSQCSEVVSSSVISVSCTGLRLHEMKEAYYYCRFQTSSYCR